MAAGTPHQQTQVFGANAAGTANVQIRCDNDGHVQADILSAALPTGAATAANQGKDPGVKVTFTGAAYAGAVLTSTETLQVSTAYWLKDWTGRLTGGTPGNTTQPSIGETSTFTQGDLNDRYKISATLTTGDDRTVDSLPGGIIVRTDAGGKLYARGAAPAAADSTLSLRAELVQMRAGA